MTAADRAARRALLVLVLTALAVIYLFPMLLTVVYSLKDRQDLFLTGPLELPTHWYSGNYQEAGVKLNLLRLLLNSLLITSVSVLLTVLLSALTGFALARGIGRRFSALYHLFVAGLLIPYQAIFVPIYLVGSRLGFVDSYAGIIFIYVAAQLPFGVFMMTGFMSTIPRDVEEAAVLDGCSTLQTFWYVVLPLLRPAVVTLAVLRALTIWNDYLLAKMFLQSSDMQTLTVGISNLFGQYRYNINIAFAAIVLASVPILLFFIINQRHLESGVTAGATKG